MMGRIASQRPGFSRFPQILFVKRMFHNLHSGSLSTWHPGHKSIGLYKVFLNFPADPQSVGFLKGFTRFQSIPIWKFWTKSFAVSGELQNLIMLSLETILGFIPGRIHKPCPRCSSGRGPSRRGSGRCSSTAGLQKSSFYIGFIRLFFQVLFRRT